MAVLLLRASLFGVFTRALILEGGECKVRSQTFRLRVDDASDLGLMMPVHTTIQNIGWVVCNIVRYDTKHDMIQNLWYVTYIYIPYYSCYDSRLSFVKWTASLGKGRHFLTVAGAHQ